ncbi:hypothetical protein [Demequina iriomotensis]|uniref:hypothetical protein n=1 Tax=Demequina iriomotensis TaxID=1536641 RepID=UPI0007801D98|nr:hypothetical protein [Demequina iriomotensis]
MSTIAPTLAAVDAAAPPLAVRLRRWALIAMPVAAGALCIVATVADPAPGVDGMGMYEAYTTGMEALQIKSFSFHWAYALWVLPALLVAASVRGRGRLLANIGAVLALFGLATMPGMLMVDWIQSAIGQLYGAEAIGEVFDLVDQQAWALPLLRTPAILGLTFALPIATWALVRARRARWWAPVAAFLACAAFMLSAATLPGTIAAAVLLTIVAVELERATRPGSGF